ncbi:MAG: hypothetical protein K6U14_11380 [Firmicutes bacterium]|nr:hypothetical protein [Alicyclobacillaceae bacterium]MCL6498215.1 hypothetical protein [Bacillota bacterium]
MRRQSPVAGSAVGFARPTLWAMSLLASMGALAVAVSLLFHSRIHTRYLEETINQRQPHAVLVAAVGTQEAPGFVGFWLRIPDDGNRLDLTPLAGTPWVTITPPGGVPEQVPLWQAVSLLPPPAAARLIARTYGLTGGYYFITSTVDLLDILDALAHHTGQGSALGSVTAMLQTLGYPDGTVHPARELALLEAMIRALPRLNPLVASSLLAVTKTSYTNLSGYQMFQLANVVRGDAFRLAALPHPGQAADHGQ